jgi:hypothetical protein
LDATSSPTKPVRLTGFDAETKCPYDLRRIVVWEADKEREIVLLTNHFEVVGK